MTDQDIAIAALIAALLPLLISTIIQPSWAPPVQALVALGVCLVVSAIASFATDDLDLADPAFDWVAWFGGIWVAAQTAYARFWKPTTVSPRIENATSPGADK